jgi:hypothetical protein
MGWMKHFGMYFCNANGQKSIIEFLHKIIKICKWEAMIRRPARKGDQSFPFSAYILKSYST